MRQSERVNLISSISDFIQFLIQDPKEGVNFISKDYRGFIHKNFSCYCGQGLLDQNGNLHHFRHSGGKLAKDQLLTKFCEKCHSEGHLNGEQKLYSKLGITETDIYNDIINQLCAYIGVDKSINIIINAISLVLQYEANAKDRDEASWPERDN